VKVHNIAQLCVFAQYFQIFIWQHCKKSLQSSVGSRQPFLPRAKRTSGSAIQGKQLQRLPMLRIPVSANYDFTVTNLKFSLAIHHFRCYFTRMKIL